MKYFTLLVFAFLVNSLNAQLKLNEIMAGNEFIGHQPENISWSPDNKTIYFRWKKNNEIVAPYYKVDLTNKTPEIIENNKTICKTTDGFISDKSGKYIYFQKNGNLYKWSSKGSELIFQKSTYFYVLKVLENNQLIISENDNLFLFEPENGRYIQLVEFKKGAAPNDKHQPTYLEQQQDELFEIVKNTKARNSARSTFNSDTKAPGIPKFYLNQNTIGWVKITNDLKHLIIRLDQYPTNKNTHVENHITESGYTETTPARPKVGAENPKHQLVVFDLESSESKIIDIKTLPNIFDKPKFLNDPTPYENPREVIFTDCWLSETNHCIVEVKSYDNKTRWIASVDLESGELKTENQQQDDAWIGGPGISGWNMVPGNIGWLNDNETFYFQSEKTGYSHLYTHNIKSGLTTQLTSGQFEIHSADLSKDGSKFYISANKNHPGNRAYYHFNIETKTWVPILTDNGNYEITISPDEKNLAVRYSYKNKPWELYIAPNKANAQLTQITTSQTEKFKSYNWKAPEVITFKTEDGKDVYARIYRPKAEVKNGAAIQFVHGAGYLQNAHNWWSGYYREYMFNNMLCDLGYTVIDIDYRASKGYGRDFRTSIYRHMGGADLNDQLLGKKYLVENEGIDPNKVGIYGGSYGGFITIMALLTHPDEFKCGAAIRSVTDWAHYNHEYTSNILNTPEQDSVAFRQSSPIYFADGLKNKLLILHGMVDDNVQFQDVVRLNQRFIELGKTNFEMALYPIEPHGFKETSSWVDEYTRILNLFNQELLD